MSGHTPGPWCRKGFKIWEQARFGQMRAGIVAEASLSWRDSATCNANARLIAAAPDLLEMLQSCRRVLKIVNIDGEDSNMIREIDAVLAKATTDDR